MKKPPHVLIVMVDQLTGMLFPDGPSAILHTPHLKKLAERSIRFGQCYCASPLCAPSRASFMSGLLPSKTGVYDNAAEFISSIPTFAHHLRRLGYRTVLSGKMHFVGPDQLHGFEERLTTDVYPADFGWTPDWARPDERIDWWYHNLGSVTDAGTGEISNQLEFDDEVAHHAKAALYRLARDAHEKPFCLTVSFTHPHDPYVARRRYWDLYDDDTIPMPKVPSIEEADPHSLRLMRANDVERFDITERNIRDSRRAYMANISYLDARIGELLEQLNILGLADDTAILFCADHGDMLGERGLWFKMSFFEGSSRVPMMLVLPGAGAGRGVDVPVSLLDVLPTLIDIAGGDARSAAASCDGQSLLPLIDGRSDRGPVLAEYAAEGSVAPMVMIRDERFKLNVCPADPPQLFDLANDPDELTNLATDPAFASDCARLIAIVDERWDLAAFDADVRASQARRALVYQALRNGHYYPWDFQPLQQASERYMRNHMDLNLLEANTRFPKP